MPYPFCIITSTAVVSAILLLRHHQYCNCQCHIPSAPSVLQLSQCRHRSSLNRLRQIFAHWQTYAAAKRALSLQGMAARHRLQQLHLRQAWQSWHALQRGAVAQRQKQYSKMVQKLLKVKQLRQQLRACDAVHVTPCT